MKTYQVKTCKLSGTDLKEVREKAHGFYQKIKKKSKRKPYVRSMYFKKEKVFLDLFWPHLFEKTIGIKQDGSNFFRVQSS